jgi:hypothetical protein
LANATFLYDRNYIASISVGGQDLDIIIDTGSSDTWVVGGNFTCVDERGRRAPGGYCGFGSTFNGTFQSVADTARFSIRYGDGTSVSGQVGYQNATVAGLTVQKQEMAFVDQAFWDGDGVTGGVMGLCYPITTRVFSSTNETLKYPGSPTHRKYDPIFTSMYKQNLTPPVFSLAMNRTSESGWLAFGGLPPVDHSPDFGKTPIRIVEADGAAALKTELSYYTIVPDDFIFGDLNTTNLTYSNPSWNASDHADVKPYQMPFIIDSGTTFSLFPESIARGYALQVPKPVFRYQDGYWALCDTKMPRFGMVIGGKTFWWKDEDLLLQDLQQDLPRENGQIATFCALGLMDILPEGPYILGDNFLSGLVSVFDVGASEMRFYERT